MFYGLRSEDIFKAENFIINQFQSPIFGENLNHRYANSRWCLLRYNHIILKLNKINSLNVDSYIKLLDKIRKKKVVLMLKKKLIIG